MKVPVLSMVQVEACEESKVKHAVEEVKKIVNDGLVASYFVIQKPRTAITHIRLKNERQQSPDQKS